MLAFWEILRTCDQSGESVFRQCQFKTSNYVSRFKSVFVGVWELFKLKWIWFLSKLFKSLCLSLCLYIYKMKRKRENGREEVCVCVCVCQSVCLCMCVREKEKEIILKWIILPAVHALFGIPVEENPCRELKYKRKSSHVVSRKRKRNPLIEFISSSPARRSIASYYRAVFALRCPLFTLQLIYRQKFSLWLFHLLTTGHQLPHIKHNLK